MLESTSLGIVVTYDPDRGVPAVLGRHAIADAGLYSVCLAIQNLWLAATAEGLGVGWVSFYREEFLQELLGIPSAIRPVAWLCIGPVTHLEPPPTWNGTAGANVNRWKQPSAWTGGISGKPIRRRTPRHPRGSIESAHHPSLRPPERSRRVREVRLYARIPKRMPYRDNARYCYPREALRIPVSCTRASASTQTLDDAARGLPHLHGDGVGELFDAFSEKLSVDRPASTSALTNSRSDRRPNPPVTATVSFEAHRSWISGNSSATGLDSSEPSVICSVRTPPPSPEEG